MNCVWAVFEGGRLSEELYGEPYFEGRHSNYWWTVGNYGNLKCFPHWREILRLIRRFKLGGKLLDIGCAYGFFVDAALDHFEAYGIDISQFAVRKSKRCCRGSIFRASAISLPFKEESFDVVTILDTLEHIPQLDQCLKDVTRVLKGEGVLFLQLPNPLIWTYICGRLCSCVGFEDETHINDFGLQQWRRILIEHGLELQKCLGMVAFASRRVRFLLKSKKAASLFPELWMIAKKC